MSAAAAGSSATMSTSSPMFLMIRPPRSTASCAASLSNASSHCTSSVSDRVRLWEV